MTLKPSRPAFPYVLTRLDLSATAKMLQEDIKLMTLRPTVAVFFKVYGRTGGGITASTFTDTLIWRFLARSCRSFRFRAGGGKS